VSTNLSQYQTSVKQLGGRPEITGRREGVKHALHAFSFWNFSFVLFYANSIILVIKIFLEKND